MCDLGRVGKDELEERKMGGGKIREGKKGKRNAHFEGE